MTVPQIDDRQWPLVRVTWAERADVSDIHAHFDALEEVVARGESFGIVIDLTALEHQTALLRQTARRRAQAVFEQGGRVIIGVAFVTPSKLTRAIVATLHWRIPTDRPMRAFSTVSAARDWIQWLIPGRSPTSFAGEEPGCELPTW